MTISQSFRVPLTLFANVSVINVYSTWSDPNNPLDPWTGYPYQWQITVDVQSQTHSDPETPIPFTYNGLSVKIGDWLIFNSKSIAVEIISVISQTDQTLVIIVEDIGLSNIINNPTQSGSGIGPVSPAGAYDCLIVSLNSNGIPVFAPLPDYSVPINLIADITNRFASYNYLQDYIPADQPGHNFQIGDFVYLNEDGSYAASIATQTRSTQSIGTVTSINQPDVGNFTYRPANRYIKNLPTLPGFPGDLLYISSSVPGGVSNTATSGAQIPVYIKITDNSAIFTSGTNTTSGVKDGQLAFGTAGGQLIGNSALTFDLVNSALNIGQISLTSDYISTTTTGQNLILSANVANVQIVNTLDLTNNRIVNVSDPIDSQDVATKSYVDAVASGLNIKATVLVATTGPLDASFNPTIYYGALTSNNYESLLIDNVAPNINDRILVKNQTDPTQNGIYVVLQTGSLGQNWILVRADDFNGQGIAGRISSGDFVFVQSGTIYHGSGWVQTSPNPITINVSDIIWTQFSEAGVILPGYGLTQNGQYFNVNAAAFVDTASGLKTISGPSGYPIIEIQLDPNSPLVAVNNAISISSTIAGTGVSYNISTGSISINSNQPTITGLGVVNTGVWNATPIDWPYGGTGNTSIGTPGQVLGVNLAGNGLQYLNHSEITESTSPPTFPIPVDGDRWYNTTSGVLFTYITDDNGSHWIQLG